MEKKITELLSVGDNIEIEIDKDSSFLNMKSDVIKIINDDVFAISNPIYRGKIYPIGIEKNISIIFNKKNLGMFYFIGEIIDRKKIGNLNVLFIKKQTEIRRFQRRDFYRLNILLDIDLQIIENGVVVKTIQAISKDISGGGLRLITKEKLEKYTVIKCELCLDGEIVEVLGKVVRCNPIPDSIIKFDVGIKFTGIQERNRSKIISFIFKQQRKIIKKGLI